MSPDEFAERLRAEGYAEIVLVERAPGGALDEHAHPFEAKALILDGEIHIQAAGGEEKRYAAGQVFHLPAHLRHAERYGPAGVRYLVGRKS
ncbi:MAG: cupin domain-containing protein [Proteobacteria bacterium]|nr:cupin domain-containing protein [Pseudomonadota bacterium]MBS0553608.1 cupin domain-containing protein [Pseudomonadota bacterium]